MSTEVDPLIGTAIAGRYVVRQKLGAGGMGSVYLATQEPLGREVAVKVMLKELIADEVAVQRFHAEAQAVSRLNHPNIVTVFDFGATDDGTLFLVMEKLAGETLVSRLRRGPLPFAEAAPVIAQVARALHAAHAKGIVHRDLKPENVMITTTDGNEVVIKVLDFGLAKMVGGERRTGLTASDVIMGTPGYMSPEQIHGFPIDARSDLYALGVISWEMLTGRQLFSATSPVKILMRHLEEIPPPPSSMMPGAGIPPGAEALIARLLEKAPERRPATAEQVAVGILNPSSESWTVAPLGAGLPSQVPAPATEPLVAAGAGGWDDAFSALGEAPFRAPTPAPLAKPRVDMRASPAMPVFANPSAVENLSPPPARAPSPAPVLSTPPPQAFDIGMPTASPLSSSPGVPQAFAPQAPPTPRPPPSVHDAVPEIARPPIVAPFSAARPRPSEPLWTITRGDRSESGIPESTMRRLAKDGHLKALDLVAPPGEEPRPAHTFALLGLRPPATPVVVVSQKKPTAVGARRSSAPIGAIVAVVVIGVALAGLFVLRPTWIDEVKALAAGATEADKPDTPPDDETSETPPSPAASTWAPVIDALPSPAMAVANADEATAEITKGRAALDDETAEGADKAERHAVAALKFASDDARARALFLEARSRRRAAARWLADVDAASLASALDATDLGSARARVSVWTALDDARALPAARALTEKSPKDAAAHVLHAEAALKLTLDEAVAAIEAARVLSPRSSRARGVHGAVLARAGLLDEAMPLLDERLRNDPTDISAILARALVEYRRGEHESAVKRLERAVAASPNDDQARLAAARVALVTRRAPARVKALFAGAPSRTTTDAHWRRFLVERAVHVDDASPTIEALGDVTFALVTIERALAAKVAPATARALDPIVAGNDASARARARTLAAEAALAGGRFDEAASTFSLAASEGNVLLGHAGLITALLEKSDVEGAARAVSALLDVDLLTGLSFDPIFDDDFYSDAPSRLAERIPATDTSENADIARALLRLAVHDLAGARASLDAAKRRDASHPVVLALFAVLELAREKPVLALFHLSKLPSTNKAGIVALLPSVLRAEAQIAADNVAAAKRAMVDIPSNDDAKGARARVLGALLAQQGQPAQARAELLSALETCPFDGRARMLLARLPTR